MTDDAAKADAERIAIVFIHGQGQQHPMEDVQELARTVWAADPNLRRQSATDPDGAYAQTFAVPDAKLGGADFVRITTENAHYRKRIDFYELYWAHLMKGNRIEHLIRWFLALQMRPREEAPDALLPIRQFSIRACEALTLLGLLAALAGCQLLPNIDGAPFVSRFVAGPDWNFEWYVAALDIGLVVLMALRFGWNEAVAGQSDHPVTIAPEEVRGRTRKALRRTHWTIWTLLGGVVLAFVVLLSRGPKIDLSDLRVVMHLCIAVAAILAIARRQWLLQASGLAILVGLTATIALFVNQTNIRLDGEYDASTATWTYEKLDVIGRTLVIGVLSLQIIATCWALSGIFKWIAVQPSPAIRVAVMMIMVVVSVGLATVVMRSGVYDPPLVWQAYTLCASLWLVVIGLGVAYVSASRAFLVPVMADAARYFSRDPDHIDARQAIREHGVKLLDLLHGVGRDDACYDRVIVVAHSLGSVVGYELLMDYWARRAGRLKIAAGSALELALADCIAKANALSGGGPDAVADFHDAQAHLHNEMCKANVSDPHNRPWLITDFITMGSPLAHTSTFMCKSEKDFRDRKTSRELSTCPPTQNDEPGKGYTFQNTHDETEFTHSAVFAPVRWTNLYFVPGPLILEGDPIAGGIAPQLGPGIKDVPLDRQDTAMVFAHNEYWRSPLKTEQLRQAFRSPDLEPVHLVALKQALALVAKGQTTAALVRQPWQPKPPSPTVAPVAGT
jgi:hypothetical protein